MQVDEIRELSKRLQKAGLEAEFKERKETIRRQLRENGNPKSTANERAWDEALEEFRNKLLEAEQSLASQAMQKDDPSSALLDTAELRAFYDAAEGSSGFIKDLRYAFENYANPNATFDSCPSKSAASLLEFARRSTAKFMELAMRYLSQVEESEVEEHDSDKAEREQEAIQKLKMLLEGKPWRCDGYPEDIKGEAVNLVASWVDAFTLEIASEAREDLVARISYKRESIDNKQSVGNGPS